MASRNRSFHLSGLGPIGRANYEALIIVKEPLFKTDKISARLVLPSGPLVLDMHDLRSLAALFTEVADEIGGMYEKRREAV